MEISTATPRPSELFEIGFAASKGRISMGLGLPMAHRIVKHHNGELSVQSKLGKGTLFKISLPLNDLPGSLSEHIMEGKQNDE